MIALRLAVLAALVVGSAPVAAQSPDPLLAARAAGQVGERYDGYMGAPQPISGIARAQLNAVNIKRRALYSNFAARRSVSPDDVAITAACTLLEGVAVGEAYLLPDHVWRRRAPGQAAPRPGYCTGN